MELHLNNQKPDGREGSPRFTSPSPAPTSANSPSASALRNLSRQKQSPETANQYNVPPVVVSSIKQEATLDHLPFDQPEEHELEAKRKYIESSIATLVGYRLPTGRSSAFRSILNQLHQNIALFSYPPSSSSSSHNRPIDRQRYSGHKLAYLLTADLINTYRRCNVSFGYDLDMNPRRVLTKPSQPARNHGYDNVDSDYILYVNDVLGDKEGQKYMVIDVLGQGTFGQVVKCRNMKTKEMVAVKVIKNKPAYFNQSTMEVSILDILNNRYDPEDKYPIVKLLDSFIFRKHLCLVFELLSVNLYELIKQNQFRGLSINLVRQFVSQLLDALCVLSEARIIHCDLKPENILLKNLDSPVIKVVDFGSACHEHQTVYTYIQSRFYRSPEILLGLPYSSSIDIWSLGCIAAELFLGLPLFPGSSEYNQICRISEMLGAPPSYMLEFGKNTKRYFFRNVDPHSKKVDFRLKSIDQFNLEHAAQERPSKRYFTSNSLRELILNYPVGTRRSSHALHEKPVNEKEFNQRLALLDFVRGLLNLNPLERWSPQQAKLHPFITGQPYVGPYMPPMEFKTKSDVRFDYGKVPSGSSSIPNSPAAAALIPSHVLEKHRPRANTISTGKLGSVPPQLQQLAALQSGTGLQITGHVDRHEMFKYQSNMELNSQAFQKQHQQTFQGQSTPTEVRAAVQDLRSMSLTGEEPSNLQIRMIQQMSRKNRSQSVSDNKAPWMQLLGYAGSAQFSPSTSRNSNHQVGNPHANPYFNQNHGYYQDNGPLAAQGQHHIGQTSVPQFPGQTNQATLDGLRKAQSHGSLTRIHEHEVPVDFQAQQQYHLTQLHRHQHPQQQLPPYYGSRKMSLSSGSLPYQNPGLHNQRRLSAPSAPNLSSMSPMNPASTFDGGVRTQNHRRRPQSISQHHANSPFASSPLSHQGSSPWPSPTVQAQPPPNILHDPAILHAYTSSSSHQIRESANLGSFGSSMDIDNVEHQAHIDSGSFSDKAPQSLSSSEKKRDGNRRKSTNK